MPQLAYQHAYYHRQAPAYLAALAAHAGAGPPDLSQPFTYVDIGCGTGITALLTAASHPTARVIGIDIDPGQIAGARALAAAAGLANLSYLEADLAAPDLDLPDFDMAVLNGMWSWIGAAAREGVLRLLARRLRPGGLVYVSYNALPGAAPMQPLRDLLAGLLPAEGDV